MNRPITMLLPSLGLSGGTAEALKLARDLKIRDVDVTVVSFWRNNQEIDFTDIRVIHLTGLIQAKFTAILSFPLVLIKCFLVLLRLKRLNGIVIATHYITVPTIFMFSRSRRFVFIQGLEWNFFSGILRKIAKLCLSQVPKFASTIFANNYLKSEFRMSKRSHNFVFPIWADKEFFGEDELPAYSHREYDVVFVLRNDKNKRPDLYYALVKELKRNTVWLKIACIAPDRELQGRFTGLVDRFIISPSREDMRELYSNSKFFIHLSDSEGFGLPPLESMGSGCIPYCRDSGGVRQYLIPEFSSLMFPRDFQTSKVVSKLLELRSDEEICTMFSNLAITKFCEGYLDSSDTRNEEISRFMQEVICRNGS